MSRQRQIAKAHLLAESRAEHLSHAHPQHAEPSSMRRRVSTASAKRKAAADSDGEAADVSPSRPFKRPFSDREIDVEGMSADDDGVGTASRPGKHEKPPKGSERSARRSRAVVLSEEEENYRDPFQEPGIDPDDDDFIEPEKQRVKTASGSGKGKVGVKSQGKTKKAAPQGTLLKSQGAGKGKGKAAKERDTKELSMKDERKSQKYAAEQHMDTSAKRPGPTDVGVRAADIDTPPPEALGILSASLATAETTESTTIPKKRKLPTIRKNKAPEQSVTNSTAAAPPSSVANPVQPQSTAKAQPISSQFSETSGSILPPIRKPAPAAATGLDLRNPTLYAELFKSSSGATPRSGLNRREKDFERQKELSRMKDEARAKRELEARQSFDLQSEADKIARFENKFRERWHNKSSTVFPNFLAGSFKDEMERRNRMRWSRKKGEQEEGEMT